MLDLAYLLFSQVGRLHPDLVSTLTIPTPPISLSMSLRLVIGDCSLLYPVLLLDCYHQITLCTKF